MLSLLMKTGECFKEWLCQSCATDLMMVGMKLFSCWSMGKQYAQKKQDVTTIFP